MIGMLVPVNRRHSLLYVAARGAAAQLIPNSSGDILREKSATTKESRHRVIDLHSIRVLRTIICVAAENEISTIFYKISVENLQNCVANALEK